MISWYVFSQLFVNISFVSRRFVIVIVTRLRMFDEYGSHCNVYFYQSSLYIRLNPSVSRSLNHKSDLKICTSTIIWRPKTFERLQYKMVPRRTVCITLENWRSEITLWTEWTIFNTINYNLEPGMTSYQEYEDILNEGIGQAIHNF